MGENPEQFRLIERNLWTLGNSSYIRYELNSRLFLTCSDDHSCFSVNFTWTASIEHPLLLYFILFHFFLLVSFQYIFVFFFFFVSIFFFVHIFGGLILFVLFLFKFFKSPFHRHPPFCLYFFFLSLFLLFLIFEICFFLCINWKQFFCKYKYSKFMWYGIYLCD